MKKSFHILVVEDDHAVGESLQAGLTREGYIVHWKIYGEEAIQYVKEHNPDLIILDVRLPDISGIDICRRLRQMKMRQPILMLTVQGEETDKVLGLEMGADDYVTNCTRSTCFANRLYMKSQFCVASRTVFVERGTLLWYHPNISRA